MVKIEKSNAYSQTKKRGIVLDILLWSILLDSGLKVFTFSNYFLLAIIDLEYFLNNLVVPNIPLWIIITQSIISVLTLIFLWGTWKWKKWGVCGLGSMIALYHIVIFVVIKDVVSILFWLLIIALSYYYLVKPIFKHFV